MKPRYIIYVVISFAVLANPGFVLGDESLLPECWIEPTPSGIRALCADGQAFTYRSTTNDKTEKINGKTIVRRQSSDDTPETSFRTDPLLCAYKPLDDDSVKFRIRLLERDLLRVAYGKEPLCYSVANFKKNYDLPASTNSLLGAATILDQNLSPPTSCDLDPPKKPIKVELKKPVPPKIPAQATPFRPRNVVDAIIHAAKKPSGSTKTMASICIAIDESGSMDDDIDFLHTNAAAVSAFLEKEYPDGVEISLAGYGEATLRKKKISPSTLTDSFRNFKTGLTDDEDHARTATRCLEANGNDPTRERITILVTDEPPGSEDIKAHPANELAATLKLYKKKGAVLNLVDVRRWKKQSSSDFIALTKKDPAWAKYAEDYRRYQEELTIYQENLQEPYGVRNRDYLDALYEYERRNNYFDLIEQFTEQNKKSIDLSFDSFSLADYNECDPSVVNAIKSNLDTFRILDRKGASVWIYTGFAEREINRKTGVCQSRHDLQHVVGAAIKSTATIDESQEVLEIESKDSKNGESLMTTYTIPADGVEWRSTPVGSKTGKSLVYTEQIGDSILGEFSTMQLIFAKKLPDGTIAKKTLFQVFGSPKMSWGNQYENEVYARAADPNHTSRAKTIPRYSRPIKLESLGDSNKFYLLTSDGMVRFFDFDVLEDD